MKIWYSLHCKARTMTILIGSTIPGLLDALKHAFGDAQELLVIREAEQIQQALRAPAITAIILSDTIVPRPTQDVAQSLWEIIAYVSRHRQPLVPIWLILDRATPAIIRDALRAETRKTGGDIYLLSSRASRRATHPDTQQAVAWLLAHLRPTLSDCSPSHHRPWVLVPATAAGGARKSTSMLNLCLYLHRRGLRVLLVDTDIGQGALLTSLRVSNEPLEFYTTLPEEYPDLVTTYPTELVRRRIYHHPSGLDALFAGHGIRDQLDMEPRQLDGLIDTIAQLDYDVVCYDMPGDWKQRNVIVSLCARSTTSPVVICPPGRKERTGALAALDVLSKVEREDGRTALDAAMICFAEGERDLTVTIAEVRNEILQRYPMLIDLGTLPHVPALISVVTEQQEFCSVFDIAPRHPYCMAVREAAHRWMDAVGLPSSALTIPDPAIDPVSAWRWRQWRWWPFSWRRTVPVAHGSPQQRASGRHGS